MTLFLMAALGLTPTAFAGDQQTTSFSNQQVADMLGSYLADKQEIEANLAEARRLLAAAKKAATASPDPAAQRVDLAPLTARVATLETQLTTVNGEITALQAALAGKADKADLDALEARVVILERRPGYDDSELRGRVAALEDAPPVVAHTTTVVTTGFHPLVYVGGNVAITKSYTPVYDTASGRVIAGVRPAWNLGDSEVAEFALDLEANLTPQIGGVGSGFGLRAVPTLVGSFGKADLGLGLGAGYDCSVLTGAGCMAEHIGGLARGTVVIGNGIGVRLHADLEVNYLTVSPEPEVRTVLGADFYVGRRHDMYVSE
jgi:chaperonin cofactor prefoldin